MKIIINFKNYDHDRNKSLMLSLYVLNFKKYDHNKSLRLHSFIN